MPEEPEKAINLLRTVDEIIIALQKLRERLGGWLSKMERHASREKPGPSKAEARVISRWENTLNFGASDKPVSQIEKLGGGTS
jgi:hypothetical protein